MSGAHLRFEIPLDRFLSDLTDAACEAVQKIGLKRKQDILHASVSKALKKVITKEMQVSAQCGKSVIGICSHVERFEPWSEDAKKLEE